MGYESKRSYPTRAEIDEAYDAPGWNSCSGGVYISTHPERWGLYSRSANGTVKWWDQKRKAWESEELFYGDLLPEWYLSGGLKDTAAHEFKHWEPRGTTAWDKVRAQASVCDARKAADKRTTFLTTTAEAAMNPVDPIPAKLDTIIELLQALKPKPVNVTVHNPAPNEPVAVDNTSEPDDDATLIREAFSRWPGCRVFRGTDGVPGHFAGCLRVIEKGVGKCFWGVEKSKREWVDVRATISSSSGRADLSFYTENPEDWEEVFQVEPEPEPESGIEVDLSHLYHQITTLRELNALPPESIVLATTGRGERHAWRKNYETPGRWTANGVVHRNPEYLLWWLTPLSLMWNPAWNEESK